MSSDKPDRRRLRVALLTNFIPPYLLPVLRELGDQVQALRVFISTPMETDRPWKSSWDGVDVVVQRSLATQHSRKFKEGFSARFVRHFPYDTLLQLRRYRPDVIISAQLGFRTLQAAVYRQLFRSSRLVMWADLSEHTEREVGTLQAWLRRGLLQFADAVVVSGTSGAAYVKSLGVAEHNITIAPYVSGPAAPSAVSSRQGTRNLRRLVFVGQLIEGKGLELFLRALSCWASQHPDQGAEMWFVGDGPLRNKLENFSTPPNVTLKFFGNVSYDEVNSYYAAAGILVFPTLSDTWGLVVNEALAAGLSVLGSRYSQAVQELVTDGVNGWTFYPDRPAEFQGALARAMACPLSDLSVMSRQSRHKIAGLTPAHSAKCFLRAIAMAHAARPIRGTSP